MRANRWARVSACLRHACTLITSMHPELAVPCPDGEEEPGKPARLLEILMAQPVVEEEQ